MWSPVLVSWVLHHCLGSRVCIYGISSEFQRHGGLPVYPRCSWSVQNCYNCRISIETDWHLLTEAPFFPGVLFYLSKWYTKKEMNLRMSIFYSAAMIAGAFGNLIAAGILNGMDGKRNISAWRWLYIIEGAITVLFGIIVCFLLPDFPETWRGLTPEQKHVGMWNASL